MNFLRHQHGWMDPVEAQAYRIKEENVSAVTPDPS
jgi:hypothetical protein